MTLDPYTAHRAHALAILDDLPPALPNPADRIALAQVHATLALAAATLVDVDVDVDDVNDPIHYVPCLRPLPSQPLAVAALKTESGPTGPGMG